MFSVIVGSASSGCELKPDPDKHAQGAATGAPPAPPREPVLPDAAVPPDGTAPPDAATPPGARTDAGPPTGDGAPKPSADATLDGRVLARCVARNHWTGHAFFHTQHTPFSVLIGSPNHWKWVNRSTPSAQRAHQIEVPLDALLRATGVAGLVPHIEVFVVSGIATDKDVLGELDDDRLNRLISRHQDPKTGAFEIAQLAHDHRSEGKPLSFEPTPGCGARPATATAPAEPCATPLCPN